MRAPVEILLVEDSPSDARLTVEAMKESRVSNVMNHVGDGEQALAYLRKEGRFREVRRPDLVLLNLNLPRKDGREVLTELKADPVLRRIPVVVLSTSEDPTDIQRSYELHANCYITKPHNLAEFIQVVRMIEEFWALTVRLPSV